MNMMKQTIYLGLLVLVFVFGCKTNPVPTGTNQTHIDSIPSVDTKPEDANALPPVSDFDPKKVSAEVKKITMADIAELISRLNTIIRDQNYELWLSYLTPEYKDYWSDPNRLAEESQRKFLKIRDISLRTLRDYFTYVVTPAKQNSRVDDIDFISQNKVVAYAVLSGERGVLYYLEKYGDQWKIGIGR